jgi:tetratricopeptide (TPR) repeat protein
MYESGDYIRANDLAHTGLGILKHVKCETRLLQADLWTTIGGAQLLATNSKEAYDSLKEALDLRLSAVGDGLMEPDHPQIANSYMSLGTAAVGVGNVDEAIDLGEKSIQIRSGREEEQIQMLAMSHHNVALASLCAGQLDKAEKFSKRSIELSRTRSPSMTKEQRL